VMEATSLDVIEGKTIIPDPIDNPFYHGVENVVGGAYWSCNLAFLRQRFLSIGGFDEDFLYAAAEDMELAHRFTKAKFQAKFHPEIIVYHPMRPGTFGSTFRRVFFVRWYVLYQYKTLEGLDLAKPALTNVMGGLHGETLNTLRRSWQDFKNFDFKNWRSSSFRVVFRLVSIPISLGCFVYWAYRYHGILNARSSAATG
jgi:GT2 family glycosyltransferase